MDPENIISEALGDASQLNAAPAEGTVDNPVQEGSQENLAAMTLAEINQFLGKDFKSKDSALKSIKDTFSYVGKKKEDIAKEIEASMGAKNAHDSLAKELNEIKKNLFYRDNPQFAPYKSVIEKAGNNPADVVNSPEFKEILGKAIGFDESQKLRTVLESSPRIAQVKDRLTKATELRGRGQKEAFESEITKAVLGIEE